MLLSFGVSKGQNRNICVCVCVCINLHVCLFFPSFIGYNGHVTLCKFKVCHLLLYTYILQNDCRHSAALSM